MAEPHRDLIHRCLRSIHAVGLCFCSLLRRPFSETALGRFRRRLRELLIRRMAVILQMCPFPPGCRLLDEPMDTTDRTATGGDGRRGCDSFPRFISSRPSSSASFATSYTALARSGSAILYIQSFASTTARIPHIQVPRHFTPHNTPALRIIAATGLPPHVFVRCSSMHTSSESGSACTA